MPYLVAGLALVGGLALLNLVLTLAVVRRLRVHTERLNLLGANPGGPRAGSEVDDFAATTVDGRALDREGLTGTVLVGFFSPSCQPCAEQLPAFAWRAAGSPDRSLAVVLAGSDDDIHDEVDRLVPVADVVVEPPGGAVAKAFGVTAVPSLVLLTDGVVTAAAGQVALLPAGPSTIGSPT